MRTATCIPMALLLRATTLLRYADSWKRHRIERSLDGYQHPDEWNGGAWLTSPTGASAVLFAGSKSNGKKYWYGYVNPAGVDLPCIDVDVTDFVTCRLSDGSPCPAEGDSMAALLIMIPADGGPRIGIPSLFFTIRQTRASGAKNWRRGNHSLMPPSTLTSICCSTRPGWKPTCLAPHPSAVIASVILPMTGHMACCTSWSFLPMVQRRWCTCLASPVNHF